MSHSSAPAVRRGRFPWLLTLGILALLLAGAGLSLWKLVMGAPPALRIGRETTFIEGPLLPDGTPDYVAAMNAEWSRGVTPENNAVIPLLEAFGPGIIFENLRDDYYAKLGVEMPPLEGPYLVNFTEFLAGDGAAHDPDDEAALLEVSPVSPEDRPEVAAWIAASEAPLEKITSAANREKFYTPILLPQPDASLLSVLLPEGRSGREAARLLALRSMLRLHAGEVDGASADAIAALRLGRLYSTGSHLITQLVGDVIYGQGFYAAEQILLSGQMTESQARDFQDQLRRIPAHPRDSRIIDWSERFIAIQSMLLLGSSSDPQLHEQQDIPEFVTTRVDRNVALPILNAAYDKIAAILDSSDRTDREQLLREFTSEIDAMRAEVNDAIRQEFFSLALDRRALSEVFGKLWVVFYLPSIANVVEASDRYEIREDLLNAAAAIAVYRARNSELPTALDDLVPEYLDSVPLDLYTGQPMRYEIVGEEFLLYGLGPNGQDDGGRQRQDSTTEYRDADDVRFGQAPE